MPADAHARRLALVAPGILPRRSHRVWHGRVACGALPLLRLTLIPAALALLAGVVAVQALPQLPPIWLDAGLIAIGATFTLRWRPARLLGIGLLGFGWACLRADVALTQRLPLALEGEDVTLIGRIAGLPQPQDGSTRFELQVESARHADAPLPFFGRVRLNWYDADAIALAPCASWRITVRMKRPRGLINPGGFDFERHALTQGIVATGYVRKDDANRELDPGRAICVDRLRLRILQGISAVLGDTTPAHVLRALAFGDQAAMDEHEWAVARATGIPHLIAISGLHIALFAGFGVWLARGLWRLWPSLTLRWPAPMLEAPLSLGVALLYALLAGFALPTRRSLVMIAAVLVASLVWRARSPFHGLALAVLVLLLADPLGVLSAGFWLSFVGVAWLILCLGGRGAVRQGWRDMLGAQAIASIGLLPLTVWFFGQSSLIGPLANIVAVPLVCLALLPLTVPGALLYLVLPSLGAPLLRLAGWLTAQLWWLLEQMAAWPAAQFYFPEPGLVALLLGLIGAAWLLLPRGMPARALGLVLFLPLLWPPRPSVRESEFDAWVLDVGQGLSIIVRTREHVLLYDAGARFPGGFDLGEAAVIPALRALGVAHLDRLVISHGDNDHAGGAAAVVAAYTPDLAEGSEPQRGNVALQHCAAGETWIWNGVEFHIVHPSPQAADQTNDTSCVLAIRTGDSELILPGDISSKVEADVLRELAALAPHIALSVPHHGSKSSSSEAFIVGLQPQLAIASAGYRSRFGHPHPSVVARYAEHDVAFLNTASSGFVHLHFDAVHGIEMVEQGRIDRHPYWRE